jgi:hypothetical protein
MISVMCTTCSKIDGPFLEECQIAISDNSELGINLGKKTVAVALQKGSGLRFYGNERHGRFPECEDTAEGDFVVRRVERLNVEPPRP